MLKFTKNALYEYMYQNKIHDTNQSGSGEKKTRYVKFEPFASDGRHVRGIAFVISHSFYKYEYFDI